jgi:uncharacterized membrane protein
MQDFHQGGHCDFLARQPKGSHETVPVTRFIQISPNCFIAAASPSPSHGHLYRHANIEVVNESTLIVRNEIIASAIGVFLSPQVLVDTMRAPIKESHLELDRNNPSSRLAGSQREQEIHFAGLVSVQIPATGCRTIFDANYISLFVWFTLFRE